MKSGFVGSDSLKTSTGNQEIIPTAPVDWNIGYSLNSFDFLNDQDCTVIINNQETVFIRGGQGFRVDENDPPIKSFKIIEAGITYNFVGSY